MSRLIATLAIVRDYLNTTISGTRAATRAHTGDERGSVTMEHVLWAVAVIAIVGIVVVAVTSYVTDQASLIQ